MIQNLIAPTTEAAQSAPFVIRPSIGSPQNGIPDLVTVAMSFETEDAPGGNNVVFLQRKNAANQWNTVRRLSERFVMHQLCMPGTYRFRKWETSHAVGAEVEGLDIPESEGM